MIVISGLIVPIVRVFKGRGAEVGSGVELKAVAGSCSGADKRNDHQQECDTHYGHSRSYHDHMMPLVSTPAFDTSQEDQEKHPLWHYSLRGLLGCDVGPFVL
ncbi:hypothetical protein [Geomonas agri]|uniref:hypothetical protein n=1 Tax=Geomonas agri TaxID=2873702 RepID=UPI001CD77ED7|nr:hypothetical protein [Geomonas agri]